MGVQVIASHVRHCINAREAFVTTAGSAEISGDVTAPGTVEEQVIPLLTEQLVVEKRHVETARVIAAVTTHNHEQVIREDLVRERVEVERVPIGRTVTAFPPVREEGDTTIIPVVEEVLVIERRLVLKEEVHLRRVRVVETHEAMVTTRSQDVVVTRTEQRQPSPAEPNEADHLNGHSNPKGTTYE
jgi:stress response protein YsnF